jgi:hypothetical protein
MNKKRTKLPVAKPWNRGAALFFSLLVAVLMLTIVMPFLFSLSSRFRVAEKSFRSMAAANLAEAGVERAIWELNYGNISLWSGNILARTLSLPSVQTADGRIAGDVDIEVLNPEGNNPVIIASGTVPWMNELSLERRLRVRMKHGTKSFFDFGVFGDEGFDLHGNAYVDSYNSENAPYDPTTRRLFGNVGTNADQRWDVVLLNNTTIYGDASTGYASDPSEVIRLANRAQITGIQKALDEPKLLPAIAPPFLTSRGAYTVANGIQNATLTESGMYSSFVLESNTKLTISGDVQLYINGDFTMGSNSIIEITPGSTVEIVLGGGVFEQSSNSAINNLSQDPKSLAILGTSDFHMMNWRSYSHFYGVVYVPEATVDYSANSDFYGSLVCNIISMSSNAGIHYDESLKSWTKYGTESLKHEVKDWQEY